MFHPVNLRKRQSKTLFFRGSALLSMALSITLAGCSADTKKLSDPINVDSLAANLQINYQVLANRGDGNCVLPNSDESSGKGNCFEVALSITSADSIDADASNKQWAIYFSQTDPLLTQAPGEFVVEHINGDLHRIGADDAFTGFAAGETKVINFIVRGLNLTEAKMMPNYYIVDEREGAHSHARVIDSTRIVIDPETGLESRPYGSDITAEQFKASASDKTPFANAKFLYQQNNAVAVEPLNSSAKASRQLIPTPKKVIDTGGELDLSAGINVTFSGLNADDVQPALARLQSFGISKSSTGVPVAIEVRADYLNGAAPAGSYQLAIGDKNITILAAEKSGAFYGVESLAALVTLGSSSIPSVYIQDEPRYNYRGMHVDVGRNFHSKQLLLDLLDQMAAYKLNKLHLHLGEDEGWRLEIPGLPELTDIGSKRCHDLAENTCLLMQLGGDIGSDQSPDGYYSRADYIELVQAANARHIQLIPSFDMPGHSRAVIKSMEARYRNFMAKGDETAAQQYLLSDFSDETVYESIQFYSDNTINVCMESPYAFLGKVIDEVKLMHLEAGQPLSVYHIGADETAGAWKDSPICQDFLANNSAGISEVSQLGPYFIQRVANLLHEKNIEVAGWSDGLSHTDPAKMPEKVQSNIWDVLPWAGVTEANKQANRGWDVVLSTPDALYFDFPYQADPKEGGYYWASRHIDTRKVFNFMPGNLAAMAEIYVGPNESHFEINDKAPLKKGVQWAGIQGQIWSETIRSSEAVEYMVFPRLLALAERAWYKPVWELPYNYNGAVYNRSTGHFNAELQTARDNAWQNFANTLGHKEFAKLDLAGIQYRVPTVGAIIENGMLRANMPYPGLAIEYRMGDAAWQPYQKPIKLAETTDPLEIRAIAADGIRKGRSLKVN